MAAPKVPHEIVLADELKGWTLEEQSVFKHICAFSSSDKNNFYDRLESGSFYDAEGHFPKTWDGSILFDFLKPTLEEEGFFKETLEKNGISYEDVFKRLKNRFINHEKVQKIFVASARAKKVGLKAHFVAYLRSRKPKDFELYGLREEYFPGIKPAVENILEGGAAQTADQPVVWPNASHLNLCLPPKLAGNDSYYGNQFIKEPIGRDKEQALLRQFLGDKTDNNFFWFQLAGVAGQGKSRLALELILQAQAQGWAAGLLETDELDRMHHHWAGWLPDRPHLIVLDYTLSRIDQISQLLKHLIHQKDGLNHPVRLLLLERQPWNRGIKEANTPTDSRGFQIAPDISESHAAWFLSLNGRTDGVNEKMVDARFGTGVLELEKLKEDALLDIVRQVISAIPNAQPNIPDEQIKAQLAQIDKEGRPLYAYFLAQEIAHGNNTQGWSSAQLLTATLAREQDKWWKAAFDDTPIGLEGDHPALRLAVLATMTKGFDAKKANAQNLGLETNVKIKRQALVLTNGNLTKNANIAAQPVPALQPDLLGEWFVITCFENGLPIKEVTDHAWQYAPNEMAEFLQRLSQDFKGNAIVTNILDCVEVESLDKNALAKAAYPLLAHFRSAKKEIPEKIVAALMIEAGRGDPGSMTGLGWCYHFGVGLPKDTVEAFGWYNKAAEAGNSGAMNNMGVCYQRGLGVGEDHIQAFGWYSRAAEAGHVSAMRNMGICYYNGTGVKKDRTQAFGWYRKAVEAGNANGMNNLAHCYQHGTGVGKDEAKAFGWYRKAAEAGDASGMNNMGICYHQGIGVEQDDTQAFGWYRKAAEAGNANAMVNIGNCYRQGIGVEQDETQAFGWYRKAAEAGNANAMVNIGDCYRQGIGVEQDETQAFGWYRKAAEAGDANGMNHLGFCFENGIGVKKDRTQAFGWYCKATGAGNSEGMNSLGFCYHKGIGVKKDEAKAFEWFSKAAEAGNPDGMSNMGICYQQGIGVEKDDTQAFGWYSKAAEAGSTNGMCHLGFCYEFGNGVNKDSVKALESFTKAAKAGNSDAMSYIVLLYQHGTNIEKDRTQVSGLHSKGTVQEIAFMLKVLFKALWRAFKHKLKNIRNELRKKRFKP